MPEYFTLAVAVQMFYNPLNMFDNCFIDCERV